MEDGKRKKRDQGGYTRGGSRVRNIKKEERQRRNGEKLRRNAIKSEKDG